MSVWVGTPCGCRHPVSVGASAAVDVGASAGVSRTSEPCLCASFISHARPQIVSTPFASSSQSPPLPTPAPATLETSSSRLIAFLCPFPFCSAHATKLMMSARQPKLDDCGGLRCHVRRLLVVLIIVVVASAGCAHNSCAEFEVRSNLLNNTFIAVGSIPNWCATLITYSGIRECQSDCDSNAVRIIPSALLHTEILNEMYLPNHEVHLQKTA